MTTRASRALLIHAGPRARARLLERGLQPSDVRVVPGAAGGPKALALHALDKVLWSGWLQQATGPVHFMGSSVGAWRLALGCLNEPVAALERWALDYVAQTYPHKPGKPPTAATLTDVFGGKLNDHIGGREAEVLSHPSFRLHVFTARGRHVLSRDGARGSKLTTPLGYAGAFVANAWRRRSMGAWVERVLFSDPRDAWPLTHDGFRTQHVALDARNLQPSVLASCSIPFWLQAVRDIPGGPKGAYWDGGITDYHLHLPYATMVGEGLVLYPHFQSTVVPGWLDKGLKRRHRATPWLDNVVLLSPSPEWVKATLPNAKVPDRADFTAYGDDDTSRQRDWTRALAECERMGDELREALSKPSLETLPLV